VTADAGGFTMRAATAATSLDRRGKTITTAVVFDVAVELDKLTEGDLLLLLTDDFEPFRRDVAAWCEATGHELVSSEATAEGLQFLIAKGPGKPGGDTLAMVISSDGLEELLSPLGFALAAALEGMAVNLYFQGPAVRVLALDFRPKLSGWARPFSRFAASSLSQAGHVPAQEKLRQLRSLGAQIYMCGPSMQHFKVDRDDLIFEHLPLVEYLSFVAVMRNASVHLYA
jgi:predicted peroxiredoxin/TusA-related sulfurtransferase